MGREDREVIRASLDRFEGDYAIAYSDAAKGRRIDLPRESTPNAKPGMHLWLYIEGGSITRVEINNQQTQDAKERIQKI